MTEDASRSGANDRALSPRTLAVQAMGCQPMVRAFERGDQRASKGPQQRFIKAEDRGWTVIGDG